MKNNLFSIDEYRNNPEFYFSKGLRYANQKNLEEAYKNLVKALQLEPDNPEYKFNMACFLSELRRQKEANRMFMDILLNFEPTMYDCYFGLGCNSFEAENNKKAAEYFEKYLYFDGDGEFSEEVAEMILYLKLYSEISHENKFLNHSAANFKKALKVLEHHENEKAMDYLYKSVISNPMNLQARNLLTMELMDRQQFIRAGYINSSVLCVSGEDIWANCLKILLLSSTKKHSKADRLSEILPFRNIGSREELLCVATILTVSNKIDVLIQLIEMYIVEYSDSLIYGILLLGYSLLSMKEKADGVIEIINGFNEKNTGLQQWVADKKSRLSHKDTNISGVEEYKTLFRISGEPMNYMYDPGKYSGIWEKNQNKKQILNKKYLPIVEGAVKHREIMYSRYYRKEIIGVLSDCLSRADGKINVLEEDITSFSAALEFIYCQLFNITMTKEELIYKYGISPASLNTAIKELSN